MRVVLTNSNDTIELIPETYDEAVQLDAFYTAAGAHTTAAITRGTDTGRAGHSQTPTSTYHKSVKIAMS